MDGHTLSVHLVSDNSDFSKDSKSRKDSSQTKATSMSSVESSSEKQNHSNISCFTTVFKNGLALSYSPQRISLKRSFNFNFLMLNRFEN